MAQLSRRQSGFTLVELLVVMTIIVTLASLGIVGIPAIQRRAQRVACQSQLSDIHKMLRIYEMDYKCLPTADGPAFVLGIWGKPCLDKGVKEAELFFCPSTKRKPEPDLSNVTPAGIDFTGPVQSGNQRRNRLSTSDDGASSTVIIANKCPDPSEITNDDDRRSKLPHSGTGICVLYLNGQTGFIDAKDFTNELPCVGPDSNIDALKWLQSGFGQ